MMSMVKSLASVERRENAAGIIVERNVAT